MNNPDHGTAQRIDREARVRFFHLRDHLEAEVRAIGWPEVALIVLVGLATLVLCRSALATAVALPGIVAEAEARTRW